MTDTELLEWIETSGHTRQEIGEMLGYSKRTIDNWFADKTLPDPARAHLRRIIADTHQPGKLRFTLDQFDTIEAARKLAGFTDRTEFFTSALTEYARTHAAKVTPMPEPLNRVADDEPPYVHKTQPAKGPKGKQAG